jgi:hypothetical protein
MEDRKERTVYGRITFALADELDGGGFDCSWHFADKGNYVRARTKWHLLDSNGYYRGYYGFTVILPKKNPAAFRLYGKGHAKRTLERYGAREYIEEAVYYALEKHGLTGEQPVTCTEVRNGKERQV